MKKCGKDCPACPFIREGKQLKVNGKQWKINRTFDCQAYNIVYAIVCQKDSCRETYIGETKRMLKARLADHCGYVRSKKLDTPTGSHFNSPGHSLADLRITIVEQSKRNNHPYRKQREEYHIQRFDTFYKGMNRQK